MAYDLATVTSQGNKLLASVISDRSSLVIDKIEVSGTKLASSTDLKSMTSISNVVTTLSANGYQKKDSSFIISTVLDNSSVTADYQAWVFGIWAHETDGGSPILMSVITSTSSPDTISKGSGTPIDYNYKFITTFSNTSSLTIQMASDTYATNDTVLHNSGDETATGTKTFQEIKISNDKFPSLVQTDGQYITLDGGNSEIVPADNSKVVHTTGDETIDGQKKFKTDPTDGAGNAYAKTVDVNQQLDKKVVDNKDGTEQLNGVQVQPFNKLSDTIGGRNLLLGTSPVKVRNSTWTNHINVDVTNLVGTTLTYSAMLDITDSTQGSVRVYLTPRDSSGTSIGDTASSNSINWGNVGKAIATITIPTGASNLDIGEMTLNTNLNPRVGSRKLEQGSIATDWTPAPEDKVNVTDMRKPASDVAGIEEVNAKQDKIGYTPADDSKVPHLSGANNFDAVPTVNNNQLLLASSLPSDLARTGSDQEFTGKNTFDTAPIDKTTGNPYITKDGVPSLPSDLARTGQAQTFTAAQTFSIAPTIKDASKDKGDNQAATMADLKSVENSAWHQLNNDKYLGGTLLYKIDQSSKRIYVSYSVISTGWSNPIADFSSIVNHIETISGSMYGVGVSGDADVYSGTPLSTSSPAYINSSQGGYYTVNSYIGFSDGTYFTYDSLVNN